VSLALSLLPPLPPEDFKPAGRVLGAELSQPPRLRKRRYTGARLKGVQYEKKVQEHLGEFYGERYIPSPWLRFFTGGAWRWCQPDGLLFDPVLGKLCIVEVKYQHTADAWWQVRHLYQPVLELIFPKSLWKYEACEVVRWYDPATLFPEPTVLAHEVGMAHPSFKVHIWHP
jgi:hypothetical protein